MGTDESCIKIRSLIWGMCVMKNPPSIWLTINPADTQDPIAQVLCGEDLDLDKFNAFDLDPSSNVVAGDPFASASFFHLIINAILETLLGIKGYGNHSEVPREKGIFGTVNTYIGTVEAQGRGTLHLHMLLWLKGSVTSKKMKELLQGESFTTCVKTFISANVHADIPHYPGAKVLSIPKQRSVVFSRPVNPVTEHYVELCNEAERRIARTVQVHQCGSACMKATCSGVVCKHRAPFMLSDTDWVSEDGQCGPKQTYGYLNNWYPSIIQAVQANHDIKLIMNGAETKNMAWYITHYVAKKQKQSFNTSALLAKALVFFRAENKQMKELTQLNKQLIQQCANTLSQQQELSAPEVVIYLMGWGDRFVLHHFETIHWHSVVLMLCKAYPMLARMR
jgi:hypothetical protein